MFTCCSLSCYLFPYYVATFGFLLQELHLSHKPITEDKNTCQQVLQPFLQVFKRHYSSLPLQRGAQWYAISFPGDNPMPRAKLKATEHHTHLCFSEQQPSVPTLFQRSCLTNALITIAFLQFPRIRTSEQEFQLRTFPIAASLGFRHSFRRCLAPLSHRIFLTIETLQFYFADQLIKTFGKRMKTGQVNTENSTFFPESSQLKDVPGFGEVTAKEG